MKCFNVFIPFAAKFRNHVYDSQSQLRPAFALAERLAFQDLIEHVACDFAGSIRRGLCPKLGRELFQSAGATQGRVE